MSPSCSLRAFFSASVILPDWSFSRELLELLGGLLEVPLGQVLGEVEAGPELAISLSCCSCRLICSGEPSCFWRSFTASVSLLSWTRAWSFWAGGAFARVSAAFSISARSLSASANLVLSSSLRWLATFLPRALVCCATTRFSIGLGGPGLGPSLRRARARRASRRPAPPGMSGNQASRGSLGPNAEPTSSADTWRTASAIRARPASLSRRASGSVRAVLSRSLRWNAWSMATAASIRLGPRTHRDQGGRDHAQPAGDRQRQPLLPRQRPIGELLRREGQRRQGQRARPAPDQRRQESLEPQPPPDPPDRPVQLSHGSTPLVSARPDLSDERHSSDSIAYDPTAASRADEPFRTGDQPVEP